MKKAILPLILFSIFLSSCSKKEDISIKEEQTNLSSSPLVGSWKYFGYTYGTNGSEVRDNDECEDDNVYIFNGDGTYQYDAYQMNSDTDECIVTVNQTGTWKSVSNNTIELTYIREPEPYIYELDFVISDDVLGIIEEDGNNIFSHKYRKQ